MYDLGDPKSALQDFLEDYNDEARLLSKGIGWLDEAMEDIDELIPQIRKCPDGGGQLANELARAARKLRTARGIIWRRYDRMVMGCGVNGGRMLEEIIDALSQKENPENDEWGDEEYE